MMEKDLMDLSKNERRLLKILADEWQKSGPPGYVETSKIAQHLAISIADAKSAIRSLFVRGLVDTDEVDTFAAYLTPEGYELARKDEDDNAIA
jgi:Mn-dependent DtxR family transcriptional regulator